MNLRSWLTPLLFFSNNTVSLIGVVLVTIATVTWLLFLPVTLRGGLTHPYFGILVYLLLPGVFLLGLILWKPAYCSQNKFSSVYHSRYFV